MGIYDKQKANVKKRLVEKGQAVIWRKAVSQPVSSQPWKSAGTTFESNEVSILYLPSNDKTVKYLRGTDVEGDFLFAMLHAVSFELNLSDTVLLPDGSILAISNIRSFAPNGDAIFHLIEFTK